MRKIAKIVYMFFLVFAVLAIPASAQPATTVSIGDASAMPGSSVTMPIMVNDVTNLGLGKITVTYNLSVVHVTAVASGTGNALTVTSYTINNSIGLVEILAHDPGTPHNGSVIFANVTYKAEDSEGSLSPLNITARLRDWNYPYPDIQHTITNGTFTVIPSGETTPTPTPTSSSPSSTGGGPRGSGGDYMLTTPALTPTEKTPAVEKALRTISRLEAGKPGSVTFDGLNVYKISIEVDKNVNDVNVMVEKVEKPEEITDAPGIVYLYYNITATNLTNVNVTATIELKVNKSWMTNENVDEAKIKLYRYDEGWKVLSTFKIDEDDAYVYFSAETHGFSIFAISGEEKVGVAAAPSPTLAPGITPPSTTPTPTPTPVSVPRIPTSFLILIVIVAIVIAGIIIIVVRR